MIDAHQHFWTVGDGRYDYPSPSDGVLYRTQLPEHLAPLLAAAGVERTIAVQAVDGVWETEYLLEQARRYEFIAGVVGWCDLASADASAVIGSLQARGPLVGLRPMLQKQHDASWLLGDIATGNLAHMASAGLVFEALVDVRHLAVLGAVADRHPGLTIIVDHMAKPWRHPERRDEWAAAMRRLARAERCAVKVSGYPFDAGAADDADYRDLCTLLLESFGPERLIWGSDWPVSTRHLAYPEAAARASLAFDARTWASVRGANAARWYGLGADTSVSARKEVQAR